MKLLMKNLSLAIVSMNIYVYDDDNSDDVSI